MSTEEKITSPTEILIKVLEHAEYFTHAIVVTSSMDGRVQVSFGDLPIWMVRGILDGALRFIDDVEESRREE